VKQNYVLGLVILYYFLYNYLNVFCVMHSNITLPYPLNICIVQCVSVKCQFLLVSHLHLARVMDCFLTYITYITLNEFLFAAPKK